MCIILYNIVQYTMLECEEVHLTTQYYLNAYGSKASKLLTSKNVRFVYVLMVLFQRNQSQLAGPIGISTLKISKICVESKFLARSLTLKGFTMFYHDQSKPQKDTRVIYHVFQQDMTKIYHLGVAITVFHQRFTRDVQRCLSFNMFLVSHTKRNMFKFTRVTNNNLEKSTPASCFPIETGIGLVKFFNSQCDSHARLRGVDERLGHALERVKVG